MIAQRAASYDFQIEVTTVCNFCCFYCIGCTQPRPFQYLTRPMMRIINVDGRSLACPFIKDASGYLSNKNLLNESATSSVLGICEGCWEIGDAR